LGGTSIAKSAGERGDKLFRRTLSRERIESTATKEERGRGPTWEEEKRSHVSFEGIAVLLREGKKRSLSRSGERGGSNTYPKVKLASIAGRLVDVNFRKGGASFPEEVFARDGRGGREAGFFACKKKKTVAPVNPTQSTKIGEKEKRGYFI